MSLMHGNTAGATNEELAVRLGRSGRMPTCRAECFADAETGRPIIHRLFINFDNEDGAGAGPSSSVAGSSPIKFLEARRRLSTVRQLRPPPAREMERSFASLDAPEVSKPK